MITCRTCQAHDVKVVSSDPFGDGVIVQCLDCQDVFELRAPNGHHWIASKEKMIIEWWPSSAKVIVDKNWKKGVHVHDAYQFQKLLKKKFGKGA